MFPTWFSIDTHFSGRKLKTDHGALMSCSQGDRPTCLTTYMITHRQTQTCMRGQYDVISFVAREKQK